MCYATYTVHPTLSYNTCVLIFFRTTQFSTVPFILTQNKNVIQNITLISKYNNAEVVDDKILMQIRCYINQGWSNDRSRSTSRPRTI